MQQPGDNGRNGPSAAAGGGLPESLTPGLDERLVAFLDGEADARTQAEIIEWQEREPALRARLEALARTTDRVRAAFDDVLSEPMPAHLLALGRVPAERHEETAQATSAVILPFRQRASKPQRQAAGGVGRGIARWGGLGAAAMLGALVLGLTAVLFSGRVPYSMVDPDIQMAQSFGAQPGAIASADTVQADTGTGSAGWLDTIAGYHNLFISSAKGAENTLFDVTPHNENELPGDILVPNLSPWGLDFQGARRIVLDGKPAFQFFYRPTAAAPEPAPSATLATTAAAFGTGHKPHPAAKRPVGAMTLFVTTSDRTADRPELPPSFQRRDGVDVTYWRHRGHGYALVGQADRGWMFSVASDIAYQTTPH